MATAFRGYSSDPADLQVANKALAAMAQGDFLATVLQAADGLVATVRMLHSDPTLGQKLRLIGTSVMDGMVLHEVLASEAVAQVAGLFDLAMESLVHHVEAIPKPEGSRADAKGEGSVGGSAGGGSGSVSGGGGNGGGSGSSSGGNGGSGSGGGSNGSSGSGSESNAGTAGKSVGGSGSGRASLIPRDTTLSTRLSRCWTRG